MAGKKVLVVDDEKLIVKGIRFSLEQDNMEVDCAYDGEEALQMAHNKEYDIILLDVMLPKLTGFEVCQQIREFSNVPVIMLTAKGDDMDKILGLEYGADDYITKPFSSRLLLARIFQLIEQREKLKRKFSNDPAMTSQALCSTELDRKFGEKLQTILEKQLDNPEFTIEDFASAVGVSRAAFFRKVKGVTGYTPNEYMRILRMKRAMELLQEGIYNVSEIAYKVGMNDPLYFSKCFKSHFGAPPSAYLHKK